VNNNRKWQHDEYNTENNNKVITLKVQRGIGNYIIWDISKCVFEKEYGFSSMHYILSCSMDTKDLSIE